MRHRCDVQVAVWDSQLPHVVCYNNPGSAAARLAIHEFHKDIPVVAFYAPPSRSSESPVLEYLEASMDRN